MPGSSRLTRREFSAAVRLAGGAGQTNPAKDRDRRLLDLVRQMQHYDKWPKDLDLAARSGVNTLRYSVPWYKAEPQPGVYDWSWIAIWPRRRDRKSVEPQ